MEKKLEVKDLTISFRTQSGIVRAVRNISFDLYKGETLAIVGESGSGKSVTSKAIIGILAGNSIVEDGEILYDGQDLLRISEDDFHKIRGDKISMIFQDPMSSLNPIMRVGQQLTEAMILKGKTSQKNARKLFNSKLAILNKNIDEVNAVNNKEALENNALQCQTFDNFCIEGSKYEQEYNEANAQAISLQLAIDNTLFLYEKKQRIDFIKVLKQVRKLFPKTFNRYVVIKDERVDKLLDEVNRAFLFDRKKIDSVKIIDTLKEINDVLNEGVSRQKPNFFRLGYYMMKNPDFNLDGINVDDLDKMTKEYLDTNFMLDFIKLGTIGIENSHKKSIEAKKNILVKTDEALEFFRQDKLDYKESRKKIREIALLVRDAIDYLSIAKKSIEYSFYEAINNELNNYFNGVKRNPIEQRKYDRQLAKYNKLIEKGKQPTWKVVPPVIVDLELAKKGIRRVMHDLRHSIREDLALDKEFDANKAMIDLIDYLKEQASKVVYKVTKKMAKAKALKLLEEVGIPEPNIRYNQYPFEFSGGMRQRIVIAIALSANPDILICDEPTTALDVTIQSQILELINKIKQERHLSVIFITHDLGVVANMADRIAVMYAGKIVEYGTSEDIFYDPRHPYTWALLSSMPDLDTKEKLEAIPGTPPNMIYPPKGDAFAERNKYALEIDFEEQPPLFEVSETHYAATWLLHPNAPKVNPPKVITERIERMKKEVSLDE